MKIITSAKLATVILVLSSFLFFSCSNNLTRDIAEKLIKEKFQLPYDEIMDFEIVDQTMYVRTTTLPIFEELQKEGVLTYSYDPNGWSGGAFGTLTDKGKQYAASDVLNTRNSCIKIIKLKVAKIEFVEITGIADNKESNTAEVEYSLIRKDVNPFGRIAFKLKESKFNKRVTFKKYDDGWRIGN